MIIKNVKKYTENCNFEDAEIYIEGERFAGSITEDASEPVIDGEVAYALPGLIDLHFHGCIGADFKVTIFGIFLNILNDHNTLL